MSSWQPISRRTLLAGLAPLALAACDRSSRRGEDTVAPAPEPSSTTGSIPSSTSTSTSAAGSTTGDAYFPPVEGQWETVSAAEAGYTESGLAALLEMVGAANSRTFVLLSEGRIVAEQYWNGADADTAQDIASAQKSVISTLIGLARDQGLLTLDDPVTGHIGPGWTNASPSEEAKITVRHLLTMTSGLDERRLTVAHEPGAVWEYNTDAYQKLRRVLEAVAGTDVNRLSQEWLFDAIGVRNTAAWAPRPGGVTDAVGDPAWALNVTAREMARFGLFAMHNGNWNGEQITDPGWFAEAWTSLPVKRDYGYLWWLLGKGRLGRRGTPEDLVAALGAQDQKIYVIPSTGLVLSRQGLAANDVTSSQSDFDTRLLAALSKARA